MTEKYCYEYVSHISQKCRLAIALSVLKTKPPNITTDQYISQLRDKLNDTSMDFDDHDLVCSDDFEFNDGDDFCEITNPPDHQDFNPNVNINNLDETICLNDEVIKDSYNSKDNGHTLEDNISIDEELDKNILINQIKRRKSNITNADTLSKKVLENIKNDSNAGKNNVAKTKTFKCDINNENQTNIEVNNSICFKNTVSNAMKDYLQSKTNSIKKTIQDSVSILNDDNFNAILNNNKANEVINKEYKSTSVSETQASMTLLNNNNFNEVSNNYNNKELITNNAHTIKSVNDIQDNISVLNDENFNKSSNNCQEVTNKKFIIRTVSDIASQNNRAESVKILENTANNTNTSMDIRRDLQALKLKEVPNNNSSKNTYIKGSQIQNTDEILTQTAMTNDYSNYTNVINDTNNLDKNETQGTELYTVNLTQQFTHISQSQNYDYQIPQHFIYQNNDDKIIQRQIEYRNEKPNLGNAENNIYSASYLVNDKTVLIGDTQQVYLDGLSENETFNCLTPNFNITANTIHGVESVPNEFNLEAYINENPITRNMETVNSHNNPVLDVRDNNKVSVIRNNDLELQNASTNYENDTNMKLNESQNNIEDNTERDNGTMDEDLENQDLDLELTSHVEIIPFKVIEELNKVKRFVNRGSERSSYDGCSYDSGYRSDSQRSVKFASQSQPGTWLNQSAFCLFNYITQCPLSSTTEEICNDISQVLGRLIDRLHEGETYPSFLEVLLQQVDDLLKEMYEGDNYDEDIIMKRNDATHRIYLLNQSQHVQKYTMEKITNVLKKVHNQITTEENQELTNTSELENLCYILHLLEILLRKFHRNPKSDSQSQNSSQNDEKPFKRTNISDIWRKKWNYLKENGADCVKSDKWTINSCGEVLNKLIVDCMEGYSLIAFAALQCYNLLQYGIE